MSVLLSVGKIAKLASALTKVADMSSSAKTATTFGAGVAVGLTLSAPVSALAGVVVGSVGTVLLIGHGKQP